MGIKLSDSALRFLIELARSPASDADFIAIEHDRDIAPFIPLARLLRDRMKEDPEYKITMSPEEHLAYARGFLTGEVRRPSLPPLGNEIESIALSLYKRDPDIEANNRKMAWLKDRLGRAVDADEYDRLNTEMTVCRRADKAHIMLKGGLAMLQVARRLLGQNGHDERVIIRVEALAQTAASIIPEAEGQLRAARLERVNYRLEHMTPPPCYGALKTGLRMMEMLAGLKDTLAADRYIAYRDMVIEECEDRDHGWEAATLNIIEQAMDEAGQA